MTDPNTPTDESNPDFNKKHPLQNEWTMWYDRGCSAQVKWGDHLKEIYTFKTVEDFWRLYNNLTSPSTVPSGITYHLFKHGVRPEWEDDTNRQGGKWVLLYKNQDEKLDHLWMCTVLACIGENFADPNDPNDETGDQICGAVISIRKKQNKIAIWIKGSKNQEVCTSIGKRMKHILEFNGPIKYQLHAEAMKTTKGSHPADLYVV